MRTPDGSAAPKRTDVPFDLIKLAICKSVTVGIRRDGHVSLSVDSKRDIPESAFVDGMNELAGIEERVYTIEAARSLRNALNALFADEDL